MANKEASLLLRIKTKGQEALESLKENFDVIAKAGAIAFGAISTAIVKGVWEYKDSEQAINSLSRAMVNAGTFSKALKDEYLQQADALSKVTLFGDEQIVQAQAAFTQQTKGLKLTQDQTRAILDFAQAQGIDAAQAAEIVGKSVGTANNALARYGIEVNATSDKSTKLTQVIDGLSGKFGGQAEAATKGLGGIEMLYKSFNDLLKSLGGQLAPTIMVVIDHLGKLLESASFVGSFVDIIAGGFNLVVRSAYSVINIFEQLGVIIGGTIGTIAGTFSQLISGNLDAARIAMKDGFKAMGEEQRALYEQHNQRIADLDAAEVERKKQSLTQEEENLKQSLANRAIIKDEDYAIQLEKDMTRLMEKGQLETDMELAILSGRNSAIYAAKVAQAEAEFKLASTQLEKNAALKKKHDAQDLLNQAKVDEAKAQMRQQSISLIAGMQNSSNQQLAAMGKAAALTQIAIETPVAIGRALSSAPPPFNFALAAGVAAAMGTQAAKIAGIPLAEGGIVLPRPGGTQATIGEAGQAEAVIPLDRAGEFGLGGGGGTTVVINVQGGMLGSESEAREFALAVDKELLKLRRNNESLSFDSGVI